MWFKADGHTILWTKDMGWSVWDWQKGWLKIEDPEDPMLDATGSGIIQRNALVVMN